MLWTCRQTKLCIGRNIYISPLKNRNKINCHSPSDITETVVVLKIKNKKMNNDILPNKWNQMDPYGPHSICTLCTLGVKHITSQACITFVITGRSALVSWFMWIPAPLPFHSLIKLTINIGCHVTPVPTVCLFLTCVSCEALRLHALCAYMW